MPKDLSTEIPPRPADTQLPSSNRELAWKVAPSLLLSFKYAWAGVVYAFQTQRNFRVHVIVGSLAFALSFLLHLTRVEIAVIALMTGVVLMMELLNTALESVVDLTVKQTYHDLARIAKDCAAAAVLIAAIASVVVASSLLLPPILVILRGVVHLI